MAVFNFSYMIRDLDTNDVVLADVQMFSTEDDAWDYLKTVVAPFMHGDPNWNPYYNVTGFTCDVNYMDYTTATNDLHTFVVKEY